MFPELRFLNRQDRGNRLKKTMKKFLFIIVSLLLVICANAQTPWFAWPATIQDVALSQECNDGFIHPLPTTSTTDLSFECRKSGRQAVIGSQLNLDNIGVGYYELTVITPDCQKFSMEYFVGIKNYDFFATIENPTNCEEAQKPGISRYNRYVEFTWDRSVQPSLSI